MRVLNDEEIIGAIHHVGRISIPRDRSIAKAQYDFDMKEFVEWLEEDCPHISQDNPYMGFRCKPNCLECRQSLKQSVEEK